MEKSDITRYIEKKGYSNPQPYINVLNRFVDLFNAYEDRYSLDDIFTKYTVGKSKSSVKFAKSVIYDFVKFACLPVEKQKKVDPEFFEETKSSSQLEEELRQKQELLKIQAEQLAKTQKEAQEEAKRLEELRIAEQKRKAEEEAKRKQEARNERIKARTEGFESEEIPAYIQNFDYMANIPKKAREYYQQNGEKDLFDLCASIGKHTILSGHAGSGKTEMVIKYAKDNEIPLFKFSCSNDVRMDDLIGTKTISDDGQTIKFQAGMLLKAVLTANKHGKAIILLDEINTLAEKVQKNINGLADGTGFIDLPMGRISINKGARFLICGTMNLSYAGTNPLNPELKDRFTIIDMPKMSKETKHKIYSQFNVSQEVEENLITLAKNLEQQQEYQKISGDVVFSTRSQLAFLEILEELEAEQIPNATKQALEITLVSKFDDKEDKEEVRNIINSIF